MMKYERPIIQINSETAEGVYAASGGAGIDANPGCDSQYMNFTYQKYTGGWDKTAKEFYGCLGCPAYRENPDGCALIIEQSYIDGAKSYNTDAGKRKPEWEAKGVSPNYEINNANGLPY